MIGAALTFARRNEAPWIQGLRELVKIPSISSQDDRANDRRRTARLLVERLRSIGLGSARVVGKESHPIVYADRLGVHGRPTVLIYGHYDVQPPGPDDRWRSPPFSAEVRGGWLLGRGASDDKGQLFIHIAAIESYLRTAGRLPVNVRCLFDGEEEIGSRTLLGLIDTRSDLLAADVLLVSDTRMTSRDRPTITYGLRGLVSMSVTVTGAPTPHHSGHFGGGVVDPARVLCGAIARLHDRHGRIAIEGFYRSVRDDARSETDYTRQERMTIRPAASVTALSSDGAPGAATIPTYASAFLDVRLVPDQDPETVQRLIVGTLARAVGRAARLDMVPGTRARPMIVDPRHPAIRAAMTSCAAAFGVPTQLTRSGGSIPVVAALHHGFGMTPVLMGFAQPDDGAHAPNERFHIPTFRRGVEASIRFLDRVSRP